MSRQVYNRRIRAVRIASAINKIEGVPVTAFAKQLSSQWANGLITGDEMKAALLKKHANTQAVNNDERPVSV